MNTLSIPEKAENKVAKAAWVCLFIAWGALLLPIPVLSLLLTVTVAPPLILATIVLSIIAMSKEGAEAGIWQLLGALIGSPIVYLIGWVLFLDLFGTVNSALSH